MNICTSCSQWSALVDELYRVIENLSATLLEVQPQIRHDRDCPVVKQLSSDSRPVDCVCGADAALKASLSAFNEETRVRQPELRPKNSEEALAVGRFVAFLEKHLPSFVGQRVESGYTISPEWAETFRDVIAAASKAYAPERPLLSALVDKAVAECAGDTRLPCFEESADMMDGPRTCVHADPHNEKPYGRVAWSEMRHREIPTGDGSSPCGACYLRLSKILGF